MSDIMKRPDDLVLVGHVLDAQGIKGLIKARPYSKDPTALFSTKEIWLVKSPALPESAVGYLIRSVKDHSGNLVLALAGVEDRDAALGLKGFEIYVSRQEFPQSEGGEYYWVDLIGKKVINLQGQSLGVVIDLMDNGAQSVLCVRDEGDKNERLIPFVEHVVHEVVSADQGSKGSIVVDWQLNW